MWNIRRDGYHCTKCGWIRVDTYPYDHVDAENLTDAQLEALEQIEWMIDAPPDRQPPWAGGMVSN
jgi:hypothetical protein